MKTSSVTVVVPTYNSARTLAACLASLQSQTLAPYEVIVVDGQSTDETCIIAKKFGANLLIPDLPGLLNARRVGAFMARSDHIAMVDSDQVLEPSALEAAMEALANADMVILGEYSLEPHTWIEKLYAADKIRLHKDWTVTSDPIGGVLLPRVFRSAVLKTAFERIPESVLRICVTDDHAIIYQEASKLSQRVAFVPSAVGHREPKSLWDLWKKHFRWGFYEAKQSQNPEHTVYRAMWEQKLRFRMSLAGILSDGAVRTSVCLMALKALPFGLGFVYQRSASLVGGRLHSHARQ